MTDRQTLKPDFIKPSSYFNLWSQLNLARLDAPTATACQSNRGTPPLRLTVMSCVEWLFLRTRPQNEPVDRPPHGRHHRRRRHCQHGLLALQLNIATSHIQHKQLFREAWKVDFGCTSSWTSVKDTVPKSVCFTFPSRAADAPLSRVFYRELRNSADRKYCHSSSQWFFSAPPPKTHLLSFNSVICII